MAGLSHSGRGPKSHRELAPEESGRAVMSRRIARRQESCLEPRACALLFERARLSGQLKDDRCFSAGLAPVIAAVPEEAKLASPLDVPDRAQLATVSDVYADKVGLAGGTPAQTGAPLSPPPRPYDAVNWQR